MALFLGGLLLLVIVVIDGTPIPPTASETDGGPATPTAMQLLFGTAPTGEIDVGSESVSVADSNDPAAFDPTTSCFCLVNMAPKSMFTGTMMKQNKVWMSSEIWSSFTDDYEKCFATTMGSLAVVAEHYEECKGNQGETLFKQYACGNYKNGPAKGLVPTNHEGKNFFEALTTRLPTRPGRPLNALQASFRGEPFDRASYTSYAFCDGEGIGATTAAPPASPSTVYNNFACNKLIDAAEYEAANDLPRSLQMGVAETSCQAALAGFSSSLDIVCGLLYQKTWMVDATDPNNYFKAAKFCEWDGSSCQFNPETKIVDGCFTTRP